MVVGEIDVGTDVLIIGSGPAGYTAAIRCGQLGLDTTLVGTQLGGVCLHLGCIPVKALMHSLDLTLEARGSAVFGVDEQATLDLKRAQEWKDKVIARLEGGIAGMLKASGVQVMAGIGSFTSSETATVKTPQGTQHINFRRAVIGTGSHFRLPDNVRLDGERVTNPYGITRLGQAPVKAVVVGGGLGGATTASLLAKMGAEVTVAYRGKALLAEVDDDVLRPALQWLQDNRVTLVPEATWQVSPDGRDVKVSAGGQDRDLKPDLVVFATPQEANTAGLGLEHTKVRLDGRGFVVADEGYRTTDPAIYAIGDVRGGARNASVAYREGLALAAILAGRTGMPDYVAVPYTIYTEPPIASAGVTERQAKKQGLEVIVGRATYAADGAAVLSGNVVGMAKVIADRASHRILGVQVVGRNATDIIGEGILAIEMGARVEDVALTLHPHPELCEVLYQACAHAAGFASGVTSR
ncbi:MAG TPA: FAD-dependent oxidoreductase [Methanocella sp.]|nr:FAD-dependent oxidoreductase [Methanocella sp.]